MEVTSRDGQVRSNPGICNPQNLRTGLKHGLDAASINDIFTWSLLFLDVEVRGTQSARQQLTMMASVGGGGDDSVVIPYNGTAGP